MKATFENGDHWTGEQCVEAGVTWWIAEDHAGNLYETREIPAYRIYLDNTKKTLCDDGHWALGPI